MTPPNTPRGFDWEEAGRELGQALGEYHALVVIGLDPVATGRVAVGIARTQAMHRRVAVGDLFAESQPIQELVQSDDPHGLVDCFLYGVSMSRIAHHVPDAGQLYVMPSGTEPPVYEEMLPNPRWHRLAAGFREVSALLVLAAPAGAPLIEKLVAATDGAILVGEVVPPQLSVARVVASVREPREGRPSPIIGVPVRPEIPEPRRPGRRLAAIAGLVVAAVLVAVIAWLAYRPLSPFGRPAPQPNCDSLAKTDHPCPPDSNAVVVAILPDTLRTDSSTIGAQPAVALPAPPPAPPVANPADSASAAAYAVELMSANTQAGAILRLQEDGRDLPAATFSPALIQGVRWFKVTSGAFSNRAEADSLLARQSRRGMRLGGVVRLPFAFLIDSVPATAVPGMVASYADRGQPVYALRQANGIAWLLVGAFESTEQASLYMESLRASGINPVLVYRKGRPF